MEFAIAATIFFGIPICLVIYTGFLIYTGRTCEPEIYPLGDATETPKTLREIRRANYEAER